MTKGWYGWAVSMMLILGLSGCGGGSHDDLSEWMAKQKGTVKFKLEPVSEPKPYQPQTYGAVGSISPFSDEKLTVLLRSEAASPKASSLITAEMSRRKEPLEAVPLNTLTMVGLLNRGGEKVALIKADNLLYQVRTGNYLGQNFGRITQITDNRITLREIVQDAAGEWIERNAELQLQEASGK
jgi:type IV pilus assembly protein PilP